MLSRKAILFLMWCPVYKTIEELEYIVKQKTQMEEAFTDGFIQLLGKFLTDNLLVIRSR